MHSLRLGARIGKGSVLLLALLIVLSGCGQAADLHSRGATPAAFGAPAAADTATPLPAPGLPGLIPPGPSTPGPAGTPTRIPLTVADAYNLFDPLIFLADQGNAVLVKQDFVDLDGREPKEALLTVSSVPGITSTQQVPFATLPFTGTRSALAVAAFDVVSATWKIQYRTPGSGVPGRASPLPTSMQGANLLNTSPPTPILQLRTEITPTAGTTLPGVALRLYAWRNGTAAPLTMRPAGATSDQPAEFEGQSDVQLIDIDHDGRAEVVVDDATRTTIWKWDGTRFVPR